MPPSTRFLQSSSDTSPPIKTTDTTAVDSDVVVILAALLCALICVVGLALVARCAWLRRSFSASGRAAGPALTPSKGLKKKALRSLPKTSFDAAAAAGGRLAECPICLVEFVQGDEIRILPDCGHGFHVSCVDTWLGSHSSCPSCRRILIVAPPSRCQLCGAKPAAGEPSFSEAGSKAREDSDANWGDFTARVSGEWDGFGAEFSAEGEPVELPESLVPAAFREWGVQVFDWQTQCPTLASETWEALFFYKLIKLLPTVGCEADAATRHSVNERVAGGSGNNVLAFGYHPSGRYICVGLVDGFEGTRMLELEHCFVNPMNWEERLRVIQVVRLEEGMVSLDKIWVFSEHWYGPFRNGEQFGGCAIKEIGFASSNAVELSEILGEWKGIESFAAAGFEGEQKNPMHQLLKVQTHNSIRGQFCLTALPKNLWCSLEVKEDGDTWAEVGWLVDCGHAMTSRFVLHKDGRLKEMIIQEEAKVLDVKL